MRQEFNESILYSIPVRIAFIKAAKQERLARVGLTILW